MNTINPTIQQTLAERGARYGKFSDQATKAQNIKACLRKEAGEGWNDLAPDQREALENIAHKIARIFNGDANYADSWHDIAGYAQLVADRLARAEAKVEVTYRPEKNLNPQHDCAKSRAPLAEAKADEPLSEADLDHILAILMIDSLFKN